MNVVGNPLHNLLITILVLIFLETIVEDMLFEKRMTFEEAYFQYSFEESIF